MLLLWRHHLPGCHSDYIFPDSCRKSSMSSNLIRGQRFNLHGSKCNNFFRFTRQVYTLSWSKLSDYFLGTHGRAHGRTEINHLCLFPTSLARPITTEMNFPSDASMSCLPQRQTICFWCRTELGTSIYTSLYTLSIFQNMLWSGTHNHFIIKGVLQICLRRHRGSLWLKFTYILNVTHCGPVMLYERGRHWFRQWLLACSVQGRLLPSSL